MMKRVVTVLSCVVSSLLFALPDLVPQSQKDIESSIAASVRNKMFYKSNTLEVGVYGGLMPYDLLVDHFNIGGRATWHFADHFGWEVVDFQQMTSRTTSFTNDLVGDATKNIQRLDVLKVKNVVATSLLVSPIYGKMRFFGGSVVYFDIYATIGFGASNVETLSLSKTVPDGTTVNTSWDPTLVVGFGFKIFLNSAMGLVVDLRDYVVNSQSYDKRSLKSNYTVMGGLLFFLPPL